jgi:hypothetical protein
LISGLFDGIFCLDLNEKAFEDLLFELLMNGTTFFALIWGLEKAIHRKSLHGETKDRLKSLVIVIG